MSYYLKWVNPSWTDSIISLWAILDVVFNDAFDVYNVHNVYNAFHVYGAHPYPLVRGELIIPSCQLVNCY